MDKKEAEARPLMGTIFLVEGVCGYRKCRHLVNNSNSSNSNNKTTTTATTKYKQNKSTQNIIVLAIKVKKCR